MEPTKKLKLGMIGLDTSHCTAFTQILNDDTLPHHVPGGRVCIAFPGGSDDLYDSHSRVAGYSDELRNRFGVELVDRPERVAEAADAILLTSLDGRTHLEQFRAIAPYGKPVFIDKPFALCLRDAEALFELADRHGVALMSTSSLRYSEVLAAGMADDRDGAVIGADTCGPMPLEATNPGWYWYGIHAVELLYTVLPTGCRSVCAAGGAAADQAVGVWADGRIGTVRGNRAENYSFGAAIHRERGSAFVSDLLGGSRPFYAPLLERIMTMFRTGVVPLNPAVTLELTRFIEAANESRATGKTVLL